MAESDSILQLGIEAARDGNREEARNLFRLLTRQDPGNSQAWLWLAGVAENRDERQAALERVVELDPSNEMAVKGLQALGVRPTVRLRDDQPTMTSSTVTPEPEPVEPVEPVNTPIPPAEPDRSRYDIDDDDPYAQFDTLSEAMAESPTAVRRTEPLPSEHDPFDDLSNDIDADPADRAQREWERRRGAGTSRLNNRYDDDDTVPARRGISPLLLGAVILVLLLVLGWVLWNLLFGGSTPNVADQQATASAVAAAGVSGTEGVPGNPTNEATAPGATTGPGGVAEPTQPVSPTGELQPTAAPGGEATAPPAEQPAQPQPPAGDLANANPAPVAPGTPLSSNGWQYDFNQPNYAAQLPGGVGNIQPQGRLVVVLTFVSNTSGTPQAIPADFFVLKDAQGRVYQANPAASSAYVIRGVNADLSQEDQIPADGLIRSVPLIFDVQPGATNLTFFASSNPSQGWVVLGGVQ